MPRNKIYKDMHNFKCPKKGCKGKLHPTKTLDSCLEFYCPTCDTYTTMSYEKANLIVSDTGRPPQSYRIEIVS